MLPDDPAALIAGKKYGSEGTAQRLLCALLINGPAYGYHKSWPLSARGRRFVAELYSRSFGVVPAGEPEFWNELNLPAVDADDKHAVDYAFLWPTVQLLVELKTLGRSHRPGQLAEYLLRARHHNPKQAIDLLYLTQPMLTAVPDHVPEGCRYAHIGWPEALEIASAVWGVSDDLREVRCLTLLREHLEAERALAPMPVRTKTVSSSPTAVLHDLPREWRRVADEGFASATQSAAGKKVALDVPPALLEDDAFEDRLAAVKLLLESRIAAAPELAGVKIWWWRSTTRGNAYTETGARAGLELRLSPPR